uniref:Peptidase S1 domain-containing protein n=1 Tax=Octopus bimaculoides TaxID=37653 RepID=A0A0L8HQ57_OCTBM
MLYLCCLSLAFVAAFAASPKDQIVAGSAAGLCEFPSIVHLEVFDADHKDTYGACGGTLIDSTHVVTAAHCL